MFTGNIQDSWLLCTSEPSWAPGSLAPVPHHTPCFRRLRVPLSVGHTRCSSLRARSFSRLHHTPCCHLKCFSTFHLSESNPLFQVFLCESSQIVAFDFILSPTRPCHLHWHFLHNSEVNFLRATTVSGPFFVLPKLQAQF